jgi:hypothetical protein
MRYALALLLLSLSSLAAGVDYDDVARTDFPARDRTVFLAGCYSMHTENVFAGFNCADSIVQVPMPEPVTPTRNENVTVTAFDTVSVYLVDAPCTLIDVTQHEHYKSFALVCYDDVIFRDGFEPQP